VVFGWTRRGVWAVGLIACFYGIMVSGGRKVEGFGWSWGFGVG